MRLVGLLREDLDPAVRMRRQRLGLAGLRRGQVAEQLLRPLEQVVAGAAGEAQHHSGGLVPAAQVVGERRACRVPHGLLATDDVPAERLVAEQEALVHAVDEVAGRVEVHVHLLDDHALLPLDLVRGEAGIAEHVDEDVERDVAVLGRALDVVRRVLLAGEGVELAADRVDLTGDLAGAGPPFGALEEHVLREVSDPVRLGRLVAGAGGEHDHHRHRLPVRQVGGEDAEPVVERVPAEDGHRSIL